MSKGFTNQIMFKIVKHGKGSIMIWGSMTTMRPDLICQVQERMDQIYDYHHILKKNVYGMFAKYNINPLLVKFQQNNNPKDMTKSIKFLVYKSTFLYHINTLHNFLI